MITSIATKTDIVLYISDLLDFGNTMVYVIYSLFYKRASFVDKL
jgi:hypothetical protein